MAIESKPTESPRFFVACLLFLFVGISAFAATDPPIETILVYSPDVVLAKVDSLKDGKITFSTIQVIKGKSPGPLVLAPVITQNFKVGDETILCRLGYASNKGTVSGTLLEGIPEWECLEVANEDGVITVLGVGSLEKVKEICAKKASAN